MRSRKDKTVIVSGATGYVGSEIARRLSEDGVRVAALYHAASDDEARTLLSSLQGSGHRAYRCRLEEAEDVAHTLQEIEKTQGPLYACVHAAWAKSDRKKLIDCTEEELRVQFDRNIYASFNLLSACASHFKKNKEGVIIGITTLGVIVPEAARGMGAYIPAKYALQGMLAVFKEELASSGVRVYSVAPDFMEGGMNGAIPKAFVEMLKAKNPKGVLTRPDDVARLISFLCSDTAIDEKRLTFPVSATDRENS